MRLSINPKTKNLMARDARIIWVNFDGHPTEVNPAGGKRSIGLIIDGCEDQTAIEQRDIFTDAGLTVKEHRDSTPEIPIFVLPVAIQFNEGIYASLNPVIIEDRPNGEQIEWGEDKLYLLQNAMLTNLKISIRASHWERSGRSGIKAYMSSMHFSLIERDDFATDYEGFDDFDGAPFGE